MCYFRMHETVVLEIIVVLHFVPTITQKSILEIGKLVKDA